MTRVLHFTLGPVQGFIAEARRTRDFWSGSFLLSLLSGHAMAEVVCHGGGIDFPKVAGDPLFGAICGNADMLHKAPYVGSLPNRFRAVVGSCPQNIGALCADRVQAKWLTICEAVWAEFIEPHAGKGSAELGHTVREIWDRQTKSFWDMQFVVGDECAGDGEWLDRRKNWRSHFKGGADGAEGGDHCRLMGEYQEISGFHRTLARDQQKGFWQAVSHDQGLDLSPDEPLCAIALVKRLFPRLGTIDGVMDWKPGKGVFKIRNWPSVSYIAAVPWLKLAMETDVGPRLNHVRTAEDALKPGHRGETETRLFGLSDNTEFFTLDGHLFHSDAIDVLDGEMLKAGTESDSASARRKLRGSLTAVAKAVGGTDKPIYPSEFFAVLQMDGDGTGSLLRDHKHVVLEGLAIFTESVRALFDPTRNSHWGALVYAGGDDVLALLPAQTAIAAAVELRALYREAFQAAADQAGFDISIADRFTLSGAIVYSQYKIPLRQALRQSKHYLEEIAKDANGRDSLAVAVLKPGGVAAEWVSAFRDGDGKCPSQTLHDLAEKGLGDAFAQGFFHSVKARYERLFDDAEKQHRSYDRKVGRHAGKEDPAKAQMMRALLRYEIVRQLGGRARMQEPEIVDARVDSFLHAATPIWREALQDKSFKAHRGHFNFETGLVLRFLAEEWRGRLQEDGH